MGLLEMSGRLWRDYKFVLEPKSASLLDGFIRLLDAPINPPISASAK